MLKSLKVENFKSIVDKDICLKNNLPFSSLSKSYRNGGVPIYKNKRESSKNFIYKGWYAKVEGTA